jgi:transcriptional regulator with XRE-family HTH domain
MEREGQVRRRAARVLREMRGWTESELAAALRVPLSTISDWERLRGERVPRPEDLQRCAEAMGFSPGLLRLTIRTTRQALDEIATLGRPPLGDLAEELQHLVRAFGREQEEVFQGLLSLQLEEEKEAAPPR